MNIVFESNIDRIVNCNSSFDRGVLRVCYTGKNNNNSFISKETFERCIDSIYNCPIVCRYDRETDTIGAHDMELVSNDAGMRLVNLTHPVGIIPESSNWWWSEIEDDSGTHEYLCVDVLLWKRQEAYQKIKRDGITAESMEITVKDGSMENGVYVINDFEFTAFCLLGTARPCFESASLEVFALDDFKSQLAEMMQEVKEFALAQSSQEVGTHINTSTEGGNETLEQNETLTVGCNVNHDTTLHAAEFTTAENTLSELRAELDNAQEELQSAQEQAENFALESQIQEELICALDAEKVETAYGVMSKYWFWDYDKEAAEVYAIDSLEGYLYGFGYAMDGDHVVIDFASKKRMKVTLAPFDEGSQSNPIGSILAEFTEAYNANDKQWAEQYRSVNSTVASMKSELTALRQFKADTENAKAACEREKVFAQFDDLLGIEAYEQLRENCAQYSTDELEEKCYAIRGRNGTVAKFSLETKTPKLPVEPKDSLPNNEPYGGIFAEFGFTAGK